MNMFVLHSVTYGRNIKTSLVIKKHEIHICLVFATLLRFTFLILYVVVVSYELLLCYIVAGFIYKKKTDIIGPFFPSLAAKKFFVVRPLRRGRVVKAGPTKEKELEN